MKIGDEVYVHGYIEEVRNDVIIVRNEGGYFGTVKDEVVGEIYGNSDFIEMRLPADKYMMVIKDGEMRFYNLDEIEITATTKSGRRE